MRGDGNAAAEVQDDQIHVLVGFAKGLCRFARDGFLVERVEEALALDALEAGDAGKLRQLVNTDRIDEEGGNAQRIRQLSGNVRAKIGGVLAVEGMQDVFDHAVGHQIGAGRNMAEQSAAAADGVQRRERNAALVQRLENERLAIGHLIGDVLEMGEILRRVLDGAAENFVFSVENSDLCGGRAGVDNKNFHMDTCQTALNPAR
ncbi:unknown [Firmicutes bacterium CAG:170]|nr:unknown [Firmicutes bacterium CAG:170]